MGNMNSDFFPQEIVESIIECLPVDPANQDSLPALVACAQVSKSFNAPARRQMFSTIRLTRSGVSFPDVPRRQHRIRVLVELLSQQSSNFALLIRKFHIEHEGMYDRDTCLDQVFHLVNARASNLESLYFSGRPWASQCWKKGHGLEGIIEPLANICRSQSLRNLHFENWMSLPAIFISDCSWVQSLRLDQVTLAPNPTNKASGSTTNRSVLRLESLQVYPGLARFWNQSAITAMDKMISKVKTFKAFIENDRDGAAFIDIILGRASHSIVSLDLLFRSDLEYLLREPLDLRSLPILRNTIFRCRSRRHSYPPPISLAASTKYMTAFLNQLLMPEQVQTITLEFDTDQFIPTGDEGIKSLGIFFLETKFPSLQSVTFIFTVHLMKCDRFRRKGISALEGALRDKVIAVLPSQPNCSTPKLEVTVTVVNTHWKLWKY